MHRRNNRHLANDASFSEATRSRCFKVNELIALSLLTGVIVWLVWSALAGLISCLLIALVRGIWIWRDGPAEELPHD